MQVIPNLQGATIVYMSIDEALAKATPQLLYQQAHQSANPKRQRELTAVRALLFCALNREIDILYDQYGKPYLADFSYHISISHTSRWVALILHTTKQVGIDIETIAERVAKVRTKFLSPAENQGILPHNYATLTTYWCAKEAVYKWYGKKGVDFASHLKIQATPPPPKPQIISALALILDMPILTQPILLSVNYTLISPDVVIAWVAESI